jgi:hypothetical protein
MPSSEFEEREYEAPLYLQLQNGGANVWAPGQVLEAHVGFDHAMLTTHPYFWGLVGYSAPPLGVMLGTYLPGHWWPRSHIDRPLPDFALNLFIQAKRPHVGTRGTKALRSAGIKGPYFKFMVAKEQQTVLESLANSTHGFALVTYAAAAFNRVTQLWAHSRAGTIVQTSTFPPARSLVGHGAWYYDSPGCIGVANPQFERIEEPSLADRITSLTSNARPSSKDRVKLEINLERLARAVEASIQKETTGEASRIAVYFETARGIDNLVSSVGSEDVEILRSYMKVAAFASIFHLQWFALGRSAA